MPSKLPMTRPIAPIASALTFALLATLTSTRAAAAPPRSEIPEVSAWQPVTSPPPTATSSSADAPTSPPASPTPTTSSPPPTSPSPPPSPLGTSSPSDTSSPLPSPTSSPTPSPTPTTSPPSPTDRGAISPAPTAGGLPAYPSPAPAPSAPAFPAPSSAAGLPAFPTIPPLAAQIGPGVLSMNLYADVGYAFGPQRRHKYYDYITKTTVEDFGRRDYTSYPLYVNQFSLAYAYVQGQYEIPDKLRFRIALHAGHIVESLYNEEMKSLQLIREAAIYYFFIPKLAMEAGIFPSYYGAEIVLNKENIHATRAYIADFTPDYEAGFRLHYHVRKDMTLRFMVINGWQEIRDQNGRKALGFVWSVNKPYKIVGDWNMYWGNEAPLGEKVPVFRHYQNLYYRIWLGKKKRWLLFPMIDFVMQKNNAKDRYDFVVSPALSLRYAITPKLGVAMRYDYLYDKADIVPELKTGTPNGWQSHSGTATFEYLPLPQLTLRVEGRYGTNKDAVFRNATNTLVREDWYGIFAASFHF